MPEENTPLPFSGKFEFIPAHFRSIERREWWLWGFATVVTLVLTIGIVTFILPGVASGRDAVQSDELRDWAKGLTALVVIFDLYTIYQRLQLSGLRRVLSERQQLFRLITEHAADMISLVDSDGRSLYASPAYEKVLGYTLDELKVHPGIEQVHPDDRDRIREALRVTRQTGRGQTMEYRIRHKDGSWRTLESTGAAIKDSKGKIENLVIVNRDITDRKRMETLLVHNSLHDALTGLPNRTLFLDRVEHSLSISKRRTEYEFAVLLIDVDEFKIINESMGHALGDEALVEIAARLLDALRETTSQHTASSHTNDMTSYTLARFGGDEFSILLEIHNPTDAIRVADAIQQKLAVPISITGNNGVAISGSIGITFGASARAGAADLLRNAEIAMHRAKRAGKACYRVFESSMHFVAVRRLELEAKLRKAIERDEIKVHYQPIIFAASGKVARVEALSRWESPEGMVLPADFIRVADESGLILPINRALLREACIQVMRWQRELSSELPLMLSANVAPKQFFHPTLVADVETALAESGLPPDSLELEIVETVAMGDPMQASKVIAELKALGVRVGIDDFGTGYSSLGRLKSLSVDTVKIDRSFVATIQDDEASFAIVRAIIELARSLRLEIVVEGIETEQQLDRLLLLGPDMLQGYLFAKPQSASQMTELLQKRLSVEVLSHVSAQVALHR